jgi:hypothetical protein
MAWERRGDKGARYFYRSRRTPEGKILKEYVGRGEKARAAADDLAGTQARRQVDQQALSAEIALLSELDRATSDLTQGADLLLKATLSAGGFHKRNYGPWRKRRAWKQSSARAGSAGRNQNCGR